MDILGDTPTVHEAAQMANDAYNTFANQRKIDGGWVRIQGFNGVSLKNQSSGYRGALYYRTINGKTEYTLSTAGTEDLKDAVQDVAQPLGLSKQYDFSIEQARNLVATLKNQEITFTGHSLGGGEAAANALATNKVAITFNAAGVGIMTKYEHGLLGRSESKISAFRVSGEIVGPLQGFVGSKADGNLINITARYGIISQTNADEIDKSTNLIRSVQLHFMTSVYKALEKSGYGRGGDGKLVYPYISLPQESVPHDADNTINRQLPRYYQPSLFKK